ncbi:LysR family transcriptional regulator [Selenomonas sp.]|uniref:LysR family transcriptional regulator n=1 Tax=Selenomonas sp. TaxID=2053611 RepID=UPI0025D5F510|nr:LysR family transcriptional regulator [Selenomonas sp.]
MNIQQMQYFDAVCRHQNITKAAAELHMSQSTLSLVMKNIEEETGLNILRHVGRNIQITEDGIALWREVEVLLRQVKRFESGVREIARRHNRLQLAMPVQLATVLLPWVLGEFHQLHPEIELEICEPSGGEALDMVEREEVDLAFVHDADERATLTLKPLPQWPICLCVPEGHPLANRAKITFSEAASHPLVLLGRNFILTREIMDKCHQLKIIPTVLHYSPHLSTIWNIVQQGIACSILTGNGILPHSGLAAVPIEGMAQKGYIVTKKGRQIYADQRCLIDFIRHKFSIFQDKA